jgi:glycosyl transferase family 2
MDATPNHSVQDVLDNFTGILSYRRHGQDSGQSAAIQEGWDHTDGDIFASLNSDDLLCCRGVFFLWEIISKNIVV